MSTEGTPEVTSWLIVRLPVNAVPHVIRALSSARFALNEAQTVAAANYQRDRQERETVIEILTSVHKRLVDDMDRAQKHELQTPVDFAHRGPTDHEA